MRAFTTLIPLLAVATTVLAVPATQQQVLLDDLSRTAKDWQHAAEDVLRKGEQQVTKWMEGGKEFIRQHGLTCEYILTPLYDRAMVVHVTITEPLCVVYPLPIRFFHRITVPCEGTPCGKPDSPAHAKALSG